MTESNTSEIAVIGAGLWGCVIANLLADKGLKVCLWDPEPAAMEQVASERRPRSMPSDWRLPESVRLASGLADALSAARLAALVTASRDVRRVANAAAALPPASAPREGWVLCTKGLDPQTGTTLSEILVEAFGAPAAARIGVLSGPCIATEVARGVPTSVVSAASSPALALTVQEVFHTARFRVYTHGDLKGVELAAALKNVIAIAAGMCDGLGFGDNTKASLITRGLAEITRLGLAMGADARTFAGLAGMGDLVVTSFSPHSRNRRCGEALGRGSTLEEARRDIGMAIEGITAAAAAQMLARQHGVAMPICQTVDRILRGEITPQAAVNALMLRDPKPEWY